MKTAVVELNSLSPYSYSASHSAPAHEGESKADYDARTWREHCHAHEDGRCYIPGIVLAKAIQSTARTLGEKIQGRRGKGWASLFDSGLVCVDPIELMTPSKDGRLVQVMKDTIDSVDVYCHANPSGGTRTGGRVWRRFPIVPVWSGVATILIVNDEITEAVVKRHVEMAGIVNGLGRWRPQVGGTNGRFKMTAFAWQDEAKLKAA